MAIKDVASAFGSSGYGSIHQEGAGVGNTKEGGVAFLWRALTVVAVLAIFSTALSSANSRWTADNLKASTIRKQQQTTGGVFQEKNTQASPIEALTLGATNEYGEYDRRALAMYKLDMVVEPYKETKITVLHPSTPLSMFYWQLVQSDDEGLPLENVEAEIDGKAGNVATVVLTEAGRTYSLLVQQVMADGSVAAEARVTISCKYVRRELRDLTLADRNAFFAVMREFYTVTLEEGKEKYGAAFSNAKRVAAFHNSDNYCYHNGMHFLNAHASFNLWVERCLQMIDPSVSMASWDFMLDAARYGTSWPESEIFGRDMFGSAVGTLENQYQISDGWFARISPAFDPDDTLVGQDIQTGHNPYGYVDASYNYQDLPGVIRTHSYCGLKGEAKFATCDTFIDCFENSDNLYDWASCMELQVHASMHGMIGGGFNCNINMAEFQAENPQFKSGLLTFTLEFLLANKWPSNSLMKGYNDCDTSCVRGQTEPCGCTCTLDPFTWSDDEVYDFMEESLVTLSERFNGDQYVYNDSSVRNSLGFMEQGGRLDQESTMLLLRQMMVIGCEPGSVGAMSTGSSPLDPIFWVLHPAFEKAYHILKLSPGYEDTYNFDWVASDCGTKSGGDLNDTVPFTEQMLGLGDNPEKLTNAEVIVLLDPSNPKVPYLYEGFEKWGTCTDWDPCPECVASPRAGDEDLPTGVSPFPRSPNQFSD